MQVSCSNFGGLYISTCIIVDWKTQYCFALTKQDQYETADEILRHIMVSNAYQATGCHLLGVNQ